MKDLILQISKYLARIVKVQIIFGANNGDIRYLVVGNQVMGAKII